MTTLHDMRLSSADFPYLATNMDTWKAVKIKPHREAVDEREMNKKEGRKEN